MSTSSLECSHASTPQPHLEAIDREERIAEELTQVFCDRERAELLVTEASFPTAMLPSFTTAQVFWAKVARDARNGALIGGLRPVVQRAAELYPANPVFAQYLEEIARPDVRRAKHQSLRLLLERGGVESSWYSRPR